MGSREREMTNDVDDTAGIGPARRWTDIARDPMNSAVIEFRRSTVATARKPPVPDRNAYLCGLARGKRILDIGVVDHDLATPRQQRWLHGELVTAAAESLGVDILDEEIERLRLAGFNVRHHDVTREQLRQRFELVVCGEVIEHVGAPGDLFDAARELLEPGGRFVLTTPNPYSLRRVVQQFRDRVVENVDHVTLIGPWGMAEFAERSGLRLDAFRGVDYRPEDGKAAYLRHPWVKRLLPMPAEAACDTIIYEVVAQG